MQLYGYASTWLYDYMTSWLFKRNDVTFMSRNERKYQSTSCPTGLLDIFVYFIFDIIMCVLVETLCDAYYEKDELY